MNHAPRPGIIAPPHQARTRAEAFLRRLVTDTVHAGAILALAKRAGISRSTLALARYAVGIETYKEYGRRHGRRLWTPTSRD